MKEYNGIWWTLDGKKVSGTLTITNENKIFLITNEKLDDTNIINGFAGSKKITLVDTRLDRTDRYYTEISKGYEDEEDINVEYSAYKYLADIAIFGHTYIRKGDIRLEDLKIKYTNLEKWVNWKNVSPEVDTASEDIILKLKNIQSKVIDVEKFKLCIAKPYLMIEEEYTMKINNEVLVLVKDIANKFIDSVKEIINCIQFFLVLCMGDNINVEEIRAKDFFNRDLEIILGYGKSNFENRIIFKNIIKYDDIKDNLENIIKKWIEIYSDNELLIANFINLQRNEQLLATEYNNLMTSIDNLYLITQNKQDTNTYTKEVIKNLITETNFILNLSENQINELAEKVKDMRRYFVHSNKTQREKVNSNISIIQLIVAMLIEMVRARIMMELGIDKEVIEKYYKNFKQLENIKYDIVNDVNDEEEVPEGDGIMKQLSKRDKEDIAELNAIMGTRYRESGYNLENSNDLIEAVENITAEYMDYNHYSTLLANVEENFDQSLEVFHPEKWFRVGQKGTTGDELIDDTINCIRQASSNMTDLFFEAEDKCKELWKILLLGDKQEAKKHFLGEDLEYTKEEALEAIEGVTENIYDIDYHNQVQEDAESFAKAIKKMLKQIQEEKKND